MMLSELTLNIVDCEHKTAPISKDGRGFASIRTTDISNGFLDFDKANKVTEKTYENWTKRLKPQPNDIILAREAPVGEVGIIPEGFKACLGQRTVLIRPNPNKIDPYYLLFLLVSPYIKHEMRIRSTGSTVEHLNMSDIRELELPELPSLAEQVEIGKTIYNLDQKITLLRQQNETLELLAQTLFKRWFVEFEFPNENGEPYKSSSGNMVQSELGEIPEGWRVGIVGDNVKHSTESTNPGKTPDVVFFHYSIPAYDNGRCPTDDFGETILSNKYIVKENSILVSKLNPSTSRIWSVFNVNENSICSTEIQVFTPLINRYSFAYGLFHSTAVKKEMAQRASGTSSSHQRVRPGDILNIECIIPSDDILAFFEQAVLKTLNKADINQEEILILTKLRDTLLPKLMSGEVRVNTF